MEQQNLKIVDPKANTIYVVVAEGEVEQRAHCGYVLVEIVHTDVLLQAADLEDKEIPEPGNAYSKQHEKIERKVHHLARQARFLMRLEPDSAIALKDTELRDAERRVGKWHQKATEALDQEKKVIVEKKEIEGKLKDLKLGYDFAVADRNSLRDSKLKLEEDIGKIRKAVGELRMKEILGT